jgi:isoleucyl-tRNA synthetase
VAEDYGYVVGLSTTLSEDLVREGLAREFVRRVQTLRKDADFNITDRIAVTYQASGGLSEAVQAYREYIQRETLADELVEAPPATGATSAEFAFDEETVTVGVRQV